MAIETLRAVRGSRRASEGLVDAPKRPPERPEREDLLLLGVVQDVAHAGGRTCVPFRRRLRITVPVPDPTKGNAIPLGAKLITVSAPLRGRIFLARPSF